jgi:hypothetical protein
MSDLQQMQRLTWMSALAQHLARTITPFLPADRELIATGMELAVVVRREGAPLRVATTHQLPTPGEASILDADAADEVLRDVQDEIALHLGAAWPLSTQGTGLRAVARPDGDAIALAFEPRSGDPAEALVLEPFRPPSPDGTRIAG